MVDDDRRSAMSAVKNNFGRWIAKERDTVTKQTNEIIKNGETSPASVFTCKMCGCDKEKVYHMEYHHESYDNPVKYIVSLCSGC